MNPSGVILTLSHSESFDYLYGVPCCCVFGPSAIAMPDRVPEEAMPLKTELESLCQRINRAWPRWWHSVPWPLILLLPCVHLPICCSSLLADDSDDRVEAMLARWNSTTGRAHGVCLQWNYAYVRLQEDPAAAGERTPPGLDLVRATKPEDYVIFSETAACGGVNKPEEI